MVNGIFAGQRATTKLGSAQLVVDPIFHGRNAIHSYDIWYHWKSEVKLEASIPWLLFMSTQCISQIGQ